MFGTVYGGAANRNRGSIRLQFSNLFTKAEYLDILRELMSFKFEGYFGEAAEGQRTAVDFVKGDSTFKKDMEKNGYCTYNGKTYYAIIAEYPEATENELYGNMFAVYANSSHLSRAMKVITYLNTNQELRDLFQYGIQGQHYELTDEGTVKLLNNEKFGIYRMDLEKTGNCFIATPTEELGADAWTYAKMQNNDSLINPLLGFDFNEATKDSDYALDVALIDEIKRLNAETLALINECTNKEDLMSLMSDTSDGLIRKHSASAGNVKLNKATNSAYDPEAPLGPDVADQTPDTSGSSPYTVYQTWLTTYGYLYTPSVED